MVAGLTCTVPSFFYSEFAMILLACCTVSCRDFACKCAALTKTQHTLCGNVSQGARHAPHRGSGVVPRTYVAATCLQLLEALALACSMPAAADLIREIEGASQFLGSQSVLSPDVFLTSLSNSLRLKVSQISKLSMQDATSLNLAINSSAFPVAAKKDLLQQVMQSALEASGNPPPARKATQTLSHPCEYFTEGDWEVMNNRGTPLGVKIMRVMDRFLLMGLTNPSESTVRNLAGVIAACHCPDASPQLLHGIVAELKNIASTRKCLPSALVHLATYPSRPQDLPQEHWDACYTATDSPCSRTVQSYASIVLRVPLRSTNKSVQSSTSPPHHQSVSSMMEALIHQYLQEKGEPKVVFANASAAASGSADSVPSDSPPLAGWPAAPSGSKLFALMPPSLPTPVQGGGSGDTSVRPKPPPLALADRPATAVGDEDADDAVSRLEQLATGAAGKSQGKGKGRAKARPDASSCAQVKVKAKGKAQSKTAAKSAAKAHAKHAANTQAKKVVKSQAKGKAKSKASSRSLLLGCGKCRGSKSGCEQCRNPAFRGRRFHKSCAPHLDLLGLVSAEMHLSGVLHLGIGVGGCSHARSEGIALGSKCEQSDLHTLPGLVVQLHMLSFLLLACLYMYSKSL